MVKEESAPWAWWRRFFTILLLILAVIALTLTAWFTYNVVSSTIVYPLKTENSEGYLTYNYPNINNYENFDSNLVNLDTWEAPMEIQKNFSYYLAGYDRQNTPVWIVPWGTYKIAEFFESNEQLDHNERLLELYVDQFYHRVQKSRTNRPAQPNNFVNTSYAIICDMSDYSYFQFSSITTIQFVTRMAQKYAGPVSELQYGFVINLTWGSQMLVTMARPILGAALDKMEMCTADEEEETQLKLLEKIPSSQLPPLYGGLKNFKPIAVYGDIKF